MTRKLASKAHSAKWSYESEGRERLRQEFPWLDRYLSQFENPVIQDIRFRLLLPFAESREYQNDFLMHLIVFAQKERSIDPSYSGYLNRLFNEATDNNDTDFFQAHAERLRFLKELPNRHVTQREEAIVALQLAVLAAWEHRGQRDLPTKTEITKLAIEILARRTGPKDRPSEDDFDEPPMLYGYRRSFPSRVPKSFDDLEAWIEFVGKIKNYSAERTRPLDQNGSESSEGDQNGEHAEFSAGAERKERILRLRFSNEMRRSKLERLRQNTVTMVECEEAMARIRVAVSGEILKLPTRLCHELAGKDPQHIQQLSEMALRLALDRLAGPETYL
jgi:hypothetical protein